MSGVGSSPALATCETSQVLLVGVSGGFPGVLPFHPTYPLARLYEGNNLERDNKLYKKKIFPDKFAGANSVLLSTLCLPVSTADNFGKQFRPRSCLMNCRA